MRATAEAVNDAGDLTIEDVQRRPDVRRIPVNRVGIKNVRHPVWVKDRAAGKQHTIAVFRMYVGLPHHVKGTHMSRFVEILHRHDREISVDSLHALLEEMTQRLEADSAYLEMSFPFFVMKRAPVSAAESFMDYRVTLIGKRSAASTEIWARIIVPVTSLCPCSKEISAYGAHNQRSYVTIAARLCGDIWLEELISIAESEASCELFGTLKRLDEKYVTEHAYDNPKFVEDVVRDVALRLDAEARVTAYVVESENFESIHNHSAYALIERDKQARSTLRRVPRDKTLTAVVDWAMLQSRDVTGECWGNTVEEETEQWRL